MGPHAKLIHSGGSFYCEHLGKALTLGLGLDGSAVLHLPGPLPPGWCKHWINCSSPHRS